MSRPIVPPTPTVAKVNVMPIIDVALVLVVVLLVTAPMITVKDMPLTLPDAATRGAEDELRVTISMGSDGELAVDEDLVTLDTLGPALAARFKEMHNDDVLVVLRADKGTPYRMIREILHEARSAGAGRLAIAIQQNEGRVS
jgi:biopolymer transport protein ExbD